MNIFLFKTSEVDLVKTISQYVSIGLSTGLELIGNKKLCDIDALEKVVCFMPFYVFIYHFIAYYIWLIRYVP